LGILSGCGGGPAVQPVVADAEATTPPDSEPSEPGVDNTYYPKQIKFLEKFKRGDSEEGPPPPTSLAQSIEYSTVVLVAEIADVVNEGVIDAEGDPDSLISASIILKPIKVLKGQLQPELDKVTVGFVAASTIDEPDPIASLRAQLPVTGPAIWMLRWAAARGPSTMGTTAAPTNMELTRYVWVHRSTIFAQGPDKVIAPTAPDDSIDATGNSVAAEAKTHRQLSRLAAYIRASTSKPQRATPTPGS
jgi:hypothetical protein